MIVVSNASPIIILSQIGLFSLLKSLFHEIQIPQAVYDEVVEQGKGRAGSTQARKALNIWLYAKQVLDAPRPHYLPATLTKTDIAVLRLAQQIKADVVLTDDLMLRKAGQKLGFLVAGVGGILLKAKHAELIETVRDPLAEAIAHGLHFSEALRQELFRAAGEEE